MGKGTLVKSGAYIEGPVLIGGHCTIGPNCCIRKYSAIGDGCHIGQAVEIKNSVIMPGCHIQHLSYIGDSVVGENCNIGAGTITANLRHDGENVKSTIKGKLVDSGRRKLGAIVSDDAKIGVRSTLYPGRKIWPAMRTMPGDIIKKDLMPQQFEW